MANIIRRRTETPNVWDPFRIMLEMFGEGGREGYAAGAPATFAPKFDVFERKDAYVFTADLPGVKEDDLDITLTENRLMVSGKREAEERKEGERFYAYEREFGAFTRTFSLPEGVDAEHVKADFKDGVLTLVVPKRPEVQPKKITVGSSTGKTRQ
jgi:HSP20 family protein